MCDDVFKGVETRNSLENEKQNAVVWINKLYEQ